MRSASAGSISSVIPGAASSASNMPLATTTRSGPASSPARAQTCPT
jgi:hypothetical protein